MLGPLRTLRDRYPTATVLATLGGCLAVVAGLAYLIYGRGPGPFSPIARAARALEEGDLEVAGATLSPDFRAELTREELRRLARRVLRRYGPISLHFYGRDCRRSGPRGRCRFTVLAFPEGARMFRSRWEVQVRKSAERWHITGLQPISMDGREVSGLSELAGRVP